MKFITKAHVLQYFEKGMHVDGRALHTLRPVKIEYGVSKSAEGSARVKLGDTDVIAGVKLEIGKPYEDTFDQGNLSVNAELLPMSSPDFETGPPGNQANELARVVDRGIRESHVIDLKKLCIKPYEQSWSVLIDICTINDGGNLLDACSLAALAALKDTKLPGLTEKGTVDYSTRTETPLPINDLPISITIYKVGNHLVVDPTIDEEKNAESRLTSAILADGTVCAFQKGGDDPFTSEQVVKMVDMAQETAKVVREQLRR